MDKKMYHLLNNITTDIEALNREEISNMEIKKIRHKAVGDDKRKSGIKKMIAAAACAAILGIGAVTTGFSHQVYAQIKALTYDISNFLGIQKDLEPYTTVVQKSITKGDITVTLNEVILDRDELVVSATKKYHNSVDLLEYSGLDADIMINGRDVTSGGSGGAKKVDEYTMDYLINCDLNKVEVNMDWDMEITFSDVTTEDGDAPQFKFEFSTNGTQLAKDTLSIPLDYTFTLPDNTVIQLSEYTSNDLGQKIYFTSDGTRMDYDLALRGRDDAGNPIYFDLSRYSNGDGRLNIDSLSGQMHEDAKSLTLVPYAVAFPKESGKLSNNFEMSGEEFTIQLP